MAKFTLQALLFSCVLAMGQASAIPAQSMKPSTGLEGSLADRAVLYDPQCYPPSEATPGSVGGAVECADYLTSLGTKDCRTSGSTVMCRSGRTVVRGIALGVDSASSHCRDIAAAVGWVLDNCPACGGDNCDIAGSQAARGNGNLVVKVSGA